MGNWCHTQVGWNYLKEFGKTLLSPETNITWDSPPMTITQTELTRSDLWGTVLVKAQLASVFDTAGWDWPNTPPQVEEVCEMYSAGRTRIVLYMADFVSGDNQIPTGAHKLFNMARFNLRMVKDSPAIVGRSGNMLYKRGDMFLPVFFGSEYRNLFPPEEMIAFRLYHSVFDQLNFAEDYFQDLLLPL